MLNIVLPLRDANNVDNLYHLSVMIDKVHEL